MINIKSNDKNYDIKNQKVILLDDDKRVVNILDVDKIDDDSIYTFNAVYSRADFEVFCDDITNDLYYVATCDVAARQEACNLQRLRRSMVIKNMLDYKVGDINILNIMPYIIIILMVIFKK